MRAIEYQTCAFFNESLWFVTDNNCFMTIDTKTQKSDFIELSNTENIIFDNVIDNMIVDNGYIYWLDRYGKNLVKYSIDRNVCDLYEMPIPNIMSKNGTCIIGIFKYQEKIYIFPQHTPYMIIFDTKLEKFDTKMDLYKIIEDNINHENGDMLSCAINNKDNIYIFKKFGKKAFKYCLQDENYEIIDLPEEIINIKFATCFNNDIYLLGEKNVYQCDLKNLKLNRIYNVYTDENKLGRISVTNNKIFILPGYGSQIHIIDKKSGNDDMFNNYPLDFMYYREDRYKYYGFCENKQYIWYAKRFGNYYLRIDKLQEKIEFFKPSMPSYKEIYDYYKSQGREIFYEKEDDIHILFVQDN